MHFWAPEIDPSHPMDCTQAERYALKRLSNGTFLAIAGEEQKIEIAPLAFMRGRTFKSAYIIADEMQNATPSQCKMLIILIQ